MNNSEFDKKPPDLPLTEDDMLSEEEVAAFVESVLPSQSTLPTLEMDFPSQNIADEALRIRLEVARHASLQQDLDYVQGCLDNVVHTMIHGDVSADRCVLDPSIIFFPIPFWDGDAEMVTCKVFSLDVDADPEAFLPVFENLLQMHWFATENPGHFSENLMPFRNRVNLINALSVFFEEMTGVQSGAAEGLVINFNLAAADLSKILFISPERPKTETYHFEGSAPIIIDDLKLLELHAQLRRYFEQKSREALGKVSAGSSIAQVKLNSRKPSGMYSIDSDALSVSQKREPLPASEISPAIKWPATKKKGRR